MTKDPVREEVLFLLRGGNAHLPFDEIVAKFPPRLRGVKPPGAAHTAWQLLEHMRICNWDILEFSRDPKHVSPQPDDYWPRSEKPPSEAAWNKSIASFTKDLAAMEKLVANPKSDLYKRFAHGTGQNLLREALLIADHNAYHLGQMMVLWRLLNR